ncbi:MULTISPECIES: hypothetical protein [Methylorubrum]|uniref:hypothetical protein n=1 Tax=Methylorubrum TaxID=2282523 RepID=UPI00209D323A|nr:MULTISPECIES: hypothetical protein [Methylorubrum]MCP1546987.1 hypothetical protein [Methylorubrum zatmanii]MCP1551734.1 hypothetical protein [Methylorubrum extorquens]MCP1577290.1 hypothetical protein [Methylorubrum extorquens]
MTEPNDPPNFAYAIPSFLGFLERAAGATDPRQFSFDLIGAFDELMLLFKPGRSFQFGEGQRHAIRHFAHRAFEAGRPLELAGCGVDVLERGLSGVIGLGDVLTLPEEERDGPSKRQRERTFMRAVKRLRHALYAAQIAIDEERADADVELPPLGDLKLLAGPTATVLPFRLETREAVKRREARQADAAAALWKRAAAYFWAAHNLDDPATPYAAGMRLLSEGLAAGFRLSAPDRITIAIAMLSAQWAVHRVFVPTYLSEPTFSVVRARTHHILDALEADDAERSIWQPEWVAGLCADVCRQANTIADAAHDRTYKRAELSVHRYLAQQAG